MGLVGIPTAGIQRIQCLISWQQFFRSNRRAAEGSRSGRAAAEEEEEREALADPPGTCGFGWVVSVTRCWAGPAGVLCLAPGYRGSLGLSAAPGLGGSSACGHVGWLEVASSMCRGCWLSAITKAAEVLGPVGARAGVPQACPWPASLPSRAGTELVELPPRTSFPHPSLSFVKAKLPAVLTGGISTWPHWGVPRLPLTKESQCPQTSSPSSQSSPGPGAWELPAWCAPRCIPSALVLLGPWPILVFLLHVSHRANIPVTCLYPCYSYFLLLAYFKLLCFAFLVASPLSKQRLHLLNADWCIPLL